MIGLIESKPTKLVNANARSYKYVVVLGCGHTDDESLPLTSKISSCSLQRLIEGIVQFNKVEGGAWLVLTGGKGVGNVNYHADVLAELAISLGVSNKSIIKIREVKNTKDEVKIISKIIKSETFLLVTSASHMRRAVQFFIESGSYNVLAHPTGYFVKRQKSINKYFYFTPSLTNLYKSNRATYELSASLWEQVAR